MKTMLTYIIITIIGLVLIIGACYLETKSFGDGRCELCEKGKYELFDVERGNYYYKCNECKDVVRYGFRM